MKIYKTNLFNKLKEMHFWRKLIISTIVIFVLIVGGIATYCFVLVKQADDLILNKNYEKAIIIYKQVANMPEVKTKISNAEKLQDSENAFKIGMKYFADKDYKDSSISFRGVIKEDSENYRISLLKISEGDKLYIVAGLINKAQQTASKQDYATSIIYMSTASSIDPTNKQINKLLVKYQTSAKAKLKAEQDALAKVKAEAEAKAQAEAKAKAKAKAIVVQTAKPVTKGKVTVKYPAYDSSIPMYKQPWIEDPWVTDQIEWAKKNNLK
ncbi:hypothetical protein KPL37_15615 [Clostridium frigoris]|uniref:Uncharacterized protein n=1 Tax=Clostridium frigoris TaxID=205327 RepID=A0ABS6BW54_9CLOT|nr:hypothetical protein [Clostridium frigoris]MBU3161148.1 hypothetical protein [Clostridium frigoris]